MSLHIVSFLEVWKAFVSSQSCRFSWFLRGFSQVCYIHSVLGPLFLIAAKKLNSRQHEGEEAESHGDKNEINRERKRRCPDREEPVSSLLLSTPFRDYSLAALWLHYLLWDGALEDHTHRGRAVCAQVCISECLYVVSYRMCVRLWPLGSKSVYREKKGWWWRGEWAVASRERKREGSYERLPAGERTIKLK